MMVATIFRVLFLCAMLVSLALGPAKTTASAQAQQTDNVLAAPVDPRLPTPHPILSNVNIRRAIAYCTNKDALVAAAYPQLTPTQRQRQLVDTFLPPEHWAYSQPAQQYPYNPAQGKALLAAEGWLEPSPGGTRENSAGAQLAIFIHSTQSELRQTYLPVFEQQMSACGIQVLRVHTESSWLFNATAGLQRRDFEMTNFAWTFDEASMADLSEIYGCNKTPSFLNNWAGQNYTGWCNPIASNALEQAVDPNLTLDQRKVLYAIAQAEFAKDSPSLPLFRWYSETPPSLTNTWEHIDFNLEVVPPTSRPLSDIRVRKAIAYCTNKTDLVRAGYPLLSASQANQMIADSFIPKEHWAYNDNVVKYPFDQTAGKRLLDQAGWTLEQDADYRTNLVGEELSIKLTTTPAGFRQAYAAIFEQQMFGCGIRVVRQHVASTWIFGNIDGLQSRDFEMSVFAWVGQADPGGESLLSCDQIPAQANNWVGQNYAGWCNHRATSAIRKAANSIGRSTRIQNYGIVQEEYANEVPVLPLFHRTETFVTAGDLTGFAPRAGEEYYNYNAEAWQIAGTDTIVHGLTQEPASLFELEDSGFVAALVRQLVRPAAVTWLNYDLQPRLFLSVPSLENGLVVTNSVAVHAGDTVLASNGWPAVLASGVYIKNAAGEEVLYQGQPLMMQQMQIRYPYKPNLRWSDGQPVVKADFQLAYQAACSATYRQSLCDRIKSISYADDNTGYTINWIPGVQDVTQVIDPLHMYPAHQVIRSGVYAGKMLNQVPVSQWSQLQEVTYTPLSYGPFMVIEWIFGEAIRLARNPYYVNGPAVMPEYKFVFVAPESTETELYKGSVDLVGAESLTGMTEAMVDAQQAGTIKVYVSRGATWEHIDFNIDPLPVVQSVTAGAPAVLNFTDSEGDPLAISIPAGAVNQPVELIYAPVSTAAGPLPSRQQPAGLSFTLTAYQNNQPLVDFAFIKPILLTTTYSDSDVTGLVETALTLYYWNGSNWLDAATTCTGSNFRLERDPAANTIRVNICHLAEFNLMGTTTGNTIFLPTVKR